MRLTLTKREVLRGGVGLAGAAILAPLAAPGPMVRPAYAAPTIDTPAPGFTGTDSEGGTHSLADYRGRVVILEWTNHQCPYVQKHYGTGNMQALQREAADAGHVWLSVISSAPGLQGHVEPGRANALTAERNAAPSAVILDPSGDIGRLYDARTTPHMYVIDPAGTLVYRGGIDDRPTARWSDVEGATNHVRQALADLAAGRPVATPVTRPYGCSVKYGSGDS
ncbi:MAG: redoxin domain-containing protein [Alphaproteobacteria bacterium]|jgi:peroxiredoxin|nr:redoxin domain-containing protein [Alphaproteobacteria bacterium]